MFDNLLESKAKKKRSTGGTVTSVVLHVLIITGAVYATLHAKEALEKPKQEEVKFVEAPKQPPPPPKPETPPPPPPKDVVAAPPPPKGFQILTPPTKIPDVIPDVDLSKKVTDEADFSGKGVAGGTSKGVEGGTPQPKNDQPFFDFQVEKVAQQISGSAPAFPEMLKSANVEGKVSAQFVVDTTGRADMSTFKVLESSHELFTQAVKNALPKARFAPAEVGGHKVKQLVQQQFVFNLSK